MGSKGLPKQVNRRQLFNIGTSEEGLAGQEDWKEEEEEEELEPAIPHYNPKLKPVLPIGPSDNYNLHPQPVPLPQKGKRGVTMVTSELVTNL